MFSFIDIPRCQWVVVGVRVEVQDRESNLVTYSVTVLTSFTDRPAAVISPAGYGLFIYVSLRDTLYPSPSMPSPTPVKSH